MVVRRQSVLRGPKSTIVKIGPGLRGGGGVRFVGKITDEREWLNEEGDEEENEEGDEEEGDVQGLYDCEMQWCPQ